MSIVLGGDIKGAYCGGEAKEMWLNGAKVWEKKADNIVRIGEHDYPFVKIGNLLWLAEDLKENLSGSVWYNNDEAFAENRKLGKLYQRQTILSFTSGLDWRLPSIDDWTNMALALGATKNDVSYEFDDFNVLLDDEITGRRGCGLNLVLGGIYRDSFADIGPDQDYAHYMTNSSVDSNMLTDVRTWKNVSGEIQKGIYYRTWENVRYKFSVRLVKDA